MKKKRVGSNKATENKLKKKKEIERKKIKGRRGKNNNLMTQIAITTKKTKNTTM